MGIGHIVGLADDVVIALCVHPLDDAGGQDPGIIPQGKRSQILDAKALSGDGLSSVGRHPSAADDTSVCIDILVFCIAVVRCVFIAYRLEDSDPGAQLPGLCRLRNGNRLLCSA